MKRISLLICIHLLILPLIGAKLDPVSHDFYMSIFEIKFNEDAASLEITGRLFVDDLNFALEETGKGKVNIGDKTEREDADEVIAAYLSQHLSISIDQKAIQVKYLGKEMEDDVLWVYLEALNINELNTISVKNTVLSDANEKQVNIVYVIVNGEERSMMMKKDNWTESLNFGQ